MWDLQRELWRAQDKASRLGHKLRSFEPAGGDDAWTAVCERCGRVCTVARSARGSLAARSGDVLKGPCQPHVPGPEGGEAIPVPARRPMESVGNAACRFKKAA
jgi:hypothetical protein